jgi:hypothetical protein
MGEVRQVKFEPKITGPTAPAPEPDPKASLALSDAPATPAPEAPAPTPAPEAPATDAPAAPAEPTPETPAVPSTLVSQEEMAKWSDEVLQNGDLSEETVKTLEARGIPRELTARYVEGYKLSAERTVAEIQGVAGGAEQYAKVQQWANTQLNPDERAAFNKTLQSGDIAAIKTAVRGVYAQYTEAMGSAPQRTVNGTSAPAGLVPFASRQELVDAIKDPRWSTRPDYRKGIEARAAISKF